MLPTRIIKILIPFALVLSFFVAACGGGSSTSTGTDFSGTVVIWHGWQGDYLAAKQKIFDAYMQQHPKVKIQLVRQDNVVDKSIAAINAGSGPDMIAWVDDSLGKLAKSRIVVPLDQYISQSYVNSTYNKAAAEGVTFDGHVYGVPESVEALTLMYNKKLISASDVPTTTDAMLAFQQSYAKAHPGNYGVVWNVEDAYFEAPWFYGFGGYYVKADGTTGLNTPESVNAAKFIASFKPYLPKQPTYDVASSLFSEGKAAAIINGPWSYSDYASKAKIDVGFATLPATPAGPAKPFVGVKSLWVTKLSKNPALDADIMKFYTNKTNQIAMAVANGEIPANTEADNDAAVKALPSVGGFAAQAQLGTALPNTPYMSGLWKPVADAVTAIWNGSQTPEAAMAAADTAAKAAVAQLQ